MNPAPPLSARQRIQFIDLLRGWAVIVMIETHVANVTLSAETAAGGLFQYITFVNGLVAPAFLFASGLAYAITARRKLRDYLSPGPPLYRQVGRLLFILLLGYALHLPRFSFHYLRNSAAPHEWQAFFQADVLQCIAVSLLICHALLLALRSDRRLTVWLAVGAAVIVLVTPFMWGVDFLAIMPAFAAEYMNGMHLSLFPLFPWSAFLFAGVITGFQYVEARQSAGDEGGRREHVAMNRILLRGLILVGLSFALAPVAPSVYPVYDYWKFSPSFFLLRLGLILMICVGLFRYEKWRGASPSSPVTLIGRESLLVYSAHLVIIYASVGPFRFSERYRHAFGYGEALLASAVLMLLMYGLAFFWDAVRHGPVRRKRFVQLLFAGTLATIFFLAP